MSTNNHLVMPAAGIDVGFFSTKFSLGTSLTPSGTEILVDQFPSMAPCLSGPVQALTGMAKHDGVLISIGGVNYFVGKSSPDLVNGRGGLREAIPNYSETPEYKALFMGALHYIAKQKKVAGSLTINYLTLGLPLSTVSTHSKALKAFAEAEHCIPSPVNPDEEIRVRIKNVMVVSQPQGALMNLNNKLGESVKNARVLVLDMGGGTFDWFVTDSLRPQDERCGAAPMGVLACASAVCDKIDPKHKSNPDVMGDIDRAMREDLPTVFVSGEEIELSGLWPAAENILRSALDQMQKKVGKLDGMKHILLTGGGAKLLEKFVPNSILSDLSKAIQMDSDPISANVRGFHQISEMCAQIAAGN